MMTYTKWKAGKKAHNEGKGFETAVETILRLRGWAVIKLPSGARWMKIEGKMTIRPVKSPFDFIATKNGLTYAFDAKTFESDRLSFSQLKRHQIKFLKYLSDYGSPAGYLVYFRPTGCIVWYSADQLWNLRRGESLDQSQGNFLGFLNDFNLPHVIMTQNGGRG
jgi:penicillin-binding protein-related factor A (putative recombinase)